MKFRPVYFLLSGVFLAAGFFSIVRFGFVPSIDFVGGSAIYYRFSRDVTENVVKDVLKNEEVVKEVQVTGREVVVKSSPITQAQADSIGAKLAEKTGDKPQLLRFENVGPTLSREILTKTFIAIGIASIGILAWVTWQFKSLPAGAVAILAMLHDTTILLGVFSLLGRIFRVEVDLLFVTAVLTTLSFSVHDTIVVYDRIRESQKKFPTLSFFDLANKAVSQTLVRSLNNSLTIIFMLVALILLGGTTIKWFVVALLVGTVAGTYSSPFVAVPLLVTWHEVSKKLKRIG